MSAKDLLVKIIHRKIADQFIIKNHYSGKVVQNSQLNFGVYWQGRLEGVLQFGPSLDKRLTLMLVKDTAWNDFLELNRMAFTETLPRNSESRAIAVCLRMIKKRYPNIKWIISYADATQCGDGTIYRAAGFVLTKIKRNRDLRIDPETGDIIHKITAYCQTRHLEFKKWPIVDGHHLRYFYFLDKSYLDKLTCPILPYSEIERKGVGMYKGKKRDKQAMTSTTGTAAVQLRPSRSNHVVQDS